MQKLISRLDIQDRLEPEKVTRYLLQCALASLVVLMLLMMLDAVTQTVLIASLGASAFIAFAVPQSLNSAPRNLVGGYVVGVTVGMAMSGLYHVLEPLNLSISPILPIICGALATGIAMFAMVLTRTEHPPAAALALGLVFNEWDATTVVVILLAIIALSAFKQVARPMLRDLF